MNRLQDARPPAAQPSVTPPRPAQPPVHNTPMPDARRALTPAMHATVARVRTALPHDPQLAQVFERCYPNTFQTTLEDLGDGRTFVVTGDIPAMWLRDSAAQVSPYLPLCAHDAEVRALVAGVIRQQAHLVLKDPYANAFNRHPGSEYSFDRPAPGPEVWERKFELDSLCAPVLLAWRYWRETGDADPLSALRPALDVILDVMTAEQDHAARSAYTFERPAEYCVLPTDTLPDAGRGAPCAVTGLIWSGFRPSDDACTYPYLIPANAMAVVALRRAADLARAVYGDPQLARRAAELAGSVQAGLEAHGTVEHPEFGRIWAYETDGLGHHVLMDDANVPSLLSLPYLGYCSPNDPLYLNTRNFVLSASNPHRHAGAHAAGVGSPHTPGRRVWPIALCMQALTAQPDDAGRAETWDLLRVLAGTTAGTDLMHESFDPDAPDVYSRPWFAWANSLLAETVLHAVDGGRSA
ncbi:glycoside hydrolase family 125 protein [Deinococcus aquiradiocola]|uniref:glycoside hydrolase family 125 protein n=1 Tax=Deinococcus aquiradiocola TaxID=393059 RepID=UPI001E400640|nr:glycoside hydrolase family 125 protein [Deinococcus aquiradiocola]